MTYSIIARIPETNEFGIAVASRFFACGALVPYLTHNAVIASQAFVNPLWGIQSMEMLSKQMKFQDILAILKQEDQGREARQFHGISSFGEIGQFTGSDCLNWAGHIKNKNVSVAGNMLTGPNVIRATLDAWNVNSHKPLAERLLTSMEAGEAAGGDKRGKQAAALKISNGQPYPFLDIRVDDHADPLGELKRLLAVADERYNIFRSALPTVENFSGMIDRRPLDKAIEAAEKKQREDGFVSKSAATSD